MRCSFSLVVGIAAAVAGGAAAAPERRVYSICPLRDAKLSDALHRTVYAYDPRDYHPLVKRGLLAEPLADSERVPPPDPPTLFFPPTHRYHPLAEATPFQTAEIAEQVHAFHLIAPSAAQRLVEECAHLGTWAEAGAAWARRRPGSPAPGGHIVKLDADGAGGSKAKKSAKRKGKKKPTQPPLWKDGRAMATADMPLFVVAREVLKPLLESLWDTFKVQRYDRGVVHRFTADGSGGGGGPRGSPLHHDPETATVLVFLNRGFRGGGIRFPRFEFELRGEDIRPGLAIAFPGGVSHEYEFIDVEEGESHVLHLALY
jgi:hypothetical protein